MRTCALCALLCFACSGDPGGTPKGFTPDVECPGKACPDNGDTQLQVGFAKASINPSASNMSVDPFAVFANWTDTNCNDQWDNNEIPGELHPAGAWMAGYGSGRPALGIHDDDGLDARVIVLRTHGLTIALAELDLVGYFYDEIQTIRDLVQQSGDKVDLVLVGSTHVHEGPDSIGIWGRDDAHSGVDPKYQDFIDHTVAQAIHAALGKLEPATVTLGSAKTEDAGSDMSAYVDDSRDPVIIDNTLTVMLFKRPADGTPITALVNWSSHPEIEGGRNHLISADYVNYLRQGLERGFTRMGTTYPVMAPDVLFINGEVGGLLTGLHTHPIGDDGQPVAKCGQPQHPPAAGCPAPGGGTQPVTPDDCFAAARAQGHGVAAFAYKAIANGAVTVADLPPAWRTKKFDVYVDNTRFQIAYLAGLFGDRRSFTNWDRSQPIDRNNTPKIETEVTYLRLGPASLMTIPGELFPELFIGGYQGEHSGAYALVHANNPNPPDLSKAPPPPYVCDLMEGDFRMAFGLTGDFVGYIIPDYDFELGSTPYVSEAMGDHYEETNSLGDRSESTLIGTIKELISYGRPGTPEMIASPCPGR
jgi:hypothetical protein